MSSQPELGTAPDERPGDLLVLAFLAPVVGAVIEFDTGSVPMPVMSESSFGHGSLSRLGLITTILDDSSTNSMESVDVSVTERA